MKSRTLIFVIILLVISLAAILILKLVRGQPQKQSVTINIQDQSTTMKLTSSAFSHNQSIPQNYTCDGENVNPPLSISGVPENTKSLALIMDDPDAPAGTWVHWAVWNIDPKTTEIAENSVPTGVVEGKTSFGKPGYGGPCPPSGTHRYFFKLYALDTTINLSSSSTKQDLEKAMEAQILDKTELIGLYSRR